jgi:hypothetical protein
MYMDGEYLCHSIMGSPDETRSAVANAKRRRHRIERKRVGNRLIITVRM